ncbi:MAG: LUD domain-containing protein [Acidimicrobiales bacterium]
MTTSTPLRFDLMPEDGTIASTAESLEEHGFAVDVVDDVDAARALVIGMIPDGSSVMTNTSVTLEETGIASAVNEGGLFDSVRTRLGELDFDSQAREMKVLANQPDFALGSVQAVTQDGVLVLASFSGSQLASYVWGAANVIFVVGAQKIVPDLDWARRRIFEHALPLEDARAFASYGMNSRVRKILEVHEEDPGRIHVVLVRQVLGF